MKEYSPKHKTNEQKRAEKARHKRIKQQRKQARGLRKASR